MKTICVVLIVDIPVVVSLGDDDVDNHHDDDAYVFDDGAFERTVQRFVLLIFLLW